MIDFPESTHVHKRLPKEAFYKHLPIKARLKDRFISDINRIYVEWSLTKDNLHLERNGEVQEIIVMLIEAKKENYDTKIIEAIARQNPHKLIFLLSFEDKRQLVIYYSKLYYSEWMEKDNVDLSARGYSLDDIWGNMIEQVALKEEYCESKELSVDERLERQEKIRKLKRMIEQTETAARKEQQPKKQFELYERLQAYKKELEEIING